MLPRERVLTTLRGGQADRVPYDLTPSGNGLDGFNREAARRFKEKTGCDDPDEYFGVERDIRWVGFENTKLDLQERFLPYHELPAHLTFANPETWFQQVPQPSSFSLNEWGTAFVVGSNTSYDHFIPPAKMVQATALKAIEDYPLPDFTAEYRYNHLTEAIKRIRANNFAAVAFMAMTIFEVAWQIRGLERLLMDFFENQELAACLLDRITERSLFRARKFAEVGIDIIHVGDDVGMEHKMLMSPATWRKWLKPRLEKIISGARAIKPDVVFFYHSDGYVEPIIPDLIEIGINALNPVQPECMDPAKLKQQYGDKIAFWGTIGIQHTLPFGTPEDVEAEVKTRIETVGKGGGLYLSPTHVIAPEVPHENLFALVRAVKKYGKYH
jgi:uroporphyrinogen decarboxylase